MEKRRVVVGHANSAKRRQPCHLEGTIKGFGASGRGHVVDDGCDGGVAGSHRAHAAHRGCNCAVDGIACNSKQGDGTQRWTRAISISYRRCCRSQDRAGVLEDEQYLPTVGGSET